jgi:hypothetical protein
MPGPIQANQIPSTGPINAVSTDNTTAVSGTSLTPGASATAAPGSATGVSGSSGSGIGVVGISQSNDAINGLSYSSQHAGVSANNDGGGYGLWARGTPAGAFQGNVQISGNVHVNGDAVNDAFYSLSVCPQHAGVSANNNAGGFGLWASGATAGYFQGDVRVVGDALNDAFNSLSHSPVHAGVSANNDAGGFGLWASGATAGCFQGNVQMNGDATVTGTLNVGGDVVLEGADCAEEFDMQANADLDPGTVVVLDQNGALEPGRQGYDRKVAGVISGAGAFRPGMILDRRPNSDRRANSERGAGSDRRGTSDKRAPVALMGKVYCKVDAQYGPVEVGDMLTTSPTSGHAMKASDPARAFGAVIGKALEPLRSGQALVPILVTLQ